MPIHHGSMLLDSQVPAKFQLANQYHLPPHSLSDVILIAAVNDSGITSKAATTRAATTTIIGSQQVLTPSLVLLHRLFHLPLVQPGVVRAVPPTTVAVAGRCQASSSRCQAATTGSRCKLEEP